jgi:general secretion pathway protein K
MFKILRNDKGIALLITVLVITLIFTLTVRFNKKMRFNMESAANLRDGVNLDYMAKSAFNAARAVLRTDAKESEYDSFHETWAELDALASVSSYFFSRGNIMVAVDDHSGRIQVNALLKKVKGKYQHSGPQVALLTNFLSMEEFALEQEQVENIIDALLDWLDPDDEVTGFGGAEDSYYQSLEQPYSCGDGPIEFIEDLLLVRGIDKEILYGGDENKGIINYLTTYGDDGKININTADPLVLQALSDQIDAEIAAAMVEYRDNEDNESELASPDWYKKVPAFPGDVTIPAELITTKSSYFAVKASAVLDAMQRTIDGVIHRKKDKSTEILSWKMD